MLLCVIEIGRNVKDVTRAGLQHHGVGVGGGMLQVFSMKIKFGVNLLFKVYLMIVSVALIVQH
jgi:hypothetical protein